MPLTPFQIGTQVLGMGFAGAIIYYLKQLETIGCKCSMNYKRTYIMYYHIFSIAVGFITLLSGISGGNIAEYIAKTSFAIPLIVLLTTAGITNVVFTLMYVEELKKDNCECSESVFRTMMYILSIIAVVTWVLILLLGIALGGVIMSMPKIQIPTLKSGKGKK
jgi:hypothetical protein